MHLGKALDLSLWLLAIMALIGVPASTAIFPSPDLPNKMAALAGLDAIPASCSQPVDENWIRKVDSVKWVAYSSPNPDPAGGYHQPAADAIYNDLRILKKAGFTGLITYGSSGIMGKQFLTIAAFLGYQGILMGIWSPTDQPELNSATNAGALPIVLGYSIGNEGMGDTHSRYSVLDLCSAISGLRTRTGKPVTTSEDIEVYYRWPQLQSVGDWLFPIAHPYWHFTKYASDAILWEQQQYAALLDQADRYVFFKEVGLPTAGAFGLSEANQDLYYRGLANTDVRFAYFEGFDQPSKAGASVEPHWGIFHSDLTPKLLAWNLMGYRLFSPDAGSKAWVEDCSRKNEDDCTLHLAGTLLSVGDDVGDRQHRSFVSFNTAGLPDDAVITSVKLKIRSAGILGTDPLKNRRNLTIDVCTPPVDKTNSRGMASTRTPTTCDTNLGAFGETPNGGWYTADLLAFAFPSINLAGLTQFRLRISGASRDAGRAYIELYGADADESNTPILLVKYRLP